MGECVLCEQQITNPLSPERLVEQMKTWLFETRVDLIEGLEKQAAELIDGSGDNFCVVTGNRMKVCVYCFTEHIFKWLVVQSVGRELLQQFIQYFNFDESRHGYWVLAEKLGITP